MRRVVTGLALAATLFALPPMVPAFAADVTFATGQKPGELATARLSGTRVFNAKGESIGQVDDVVVDANGQAQVVVIALGGFMGLGSRLVAVPFNALKVGPVVENARVLLLDVTKEQLEKAPTYGVSDPGKTERAKQKASEWAKIAKEKAIELGKQAGTAIEGVREKMSTPSK